MYLFKQGEGAFPKSLLKQKQRILDAAVAEIMCDFRNEELSLLFDMAGVQPKSLEQLKSGSVPTAQEAIAMLAAAVHLAERREEQSVRYSSALSDWFAQVEKYCALQALLVDPLMELTGLESESIPAELLKMLQDIPTKDRGASDLPDDEDLDDPDDLSEDEDWDDEDPEDYSESEFFDEYDSDPVDDDADEDDADEDIPDDDVDEDDTDDPDDPDEDEQDDDEEADDEEALASADEEADTEDDVENDTSSLSLDNLSWDKLDAFDWNFDMKQGGNV